MPRFDPAGSGRLLTRLTPHELRQAEGMLAEAREAKFLEEAMDAVSSEAHPELDEVVAEREAELQAEAEAEREAKEGDDAASKGDSEPANGKKPDITKDIEDTMKRIRSQS